MKGGTAGIVSFLTANSFIWYFAVRAIIQTLTSSFSWDQNTLINGLFYSAVILSSLFGAVLSKRFDRVKLLIVWMLIGSLTSIVPLLLSDFELYGLSAVAILLGSSFGVGMPLCLALFSQLTDFETRGVSSGAVLLLTNIGAVVFAFVGSNPALLLASSFAWRLAGLAIAFLLKTRSSGVPERKGPWSFRDALKNRTFVLYLIPWLVFSLVDRVERIYVGTFFEAGFFEFNQMLEPIVGLIFVFLSGLIADRIGRKKVLIFGFIALGLGYAAIGFAPFVELTRYFYTFVDGAAWGTFMTLYMMVLWGDLSNSHGNAEIFYTVGSLPFFLADFFALLFRQNVLALPSESAYAVFSLASFFLFIAIWPLYNASETLPEKKIRERELKEYIEKAKRAKQKHT